MKPAAELVLTTVALGMEQQLAAMPPGPERMMTAALKIMLRMLARHADDAAAMRLQEIVELRALMREAAPACTQPLATRLLDVAAQADAAAADIRISALERVLDGLRAALIELQTELETSMRPEAPALLRRSWVFLAQANARRTVADKFW
jgi:hypothetical protein